MDVQINGNAVYALARKNGKTDSPIKEMADKLMIDYRELNQAVSNGKMEACMLRLIALEYGVNESSLKKTVDNSTQHFSANCELIGNRCIVHFLHDGKEVDKAVSLLRNDIEDEELKVAQAISYGFHLIMKDLQQRVLQGSDTEWDV